jgi:hypothetical protein
LPRTLGVFFSNRTTPTHSLNSPGRRNSLSSVELPSQPHRGQPCHPRWDLLIMWVPTRATPASSSTAAPLSCSWRFRASWSFTVLPPPSPCLLVCGWPRPASVANRWSRIGKKHVRRMARALRGVGARVRNPARGAAATSLRRVRRPPRAKRGESDTDFGARRSCARDPALPFTVRLR